MMKRTPLRTMWMIFCGLMSVIYLLNPGMGVFEIIPDSIPLIGNLDEAGAVILLMSVFRYFGIDLTKKFKSKKLNK